MVEVEYVKGEWELWIDLRHISGLLPPSVIFFLNVHMKQCYKHENEKNSCTFCASPVGGIWPIWNSEIGWLGISLSPTKGILKYWSPWWASSLETQRSRLEVKHAFSRPEEKSNFVVCAKWRGEAKDTLLLQEMWLWHVFYGIFELWHRNT
jgi:hypothetical protein